MKGRRRGAAFYYIDASIVRFIALFEEALGLRQITTSYETRQTVKDIVERKAIVLVNDDGNVAAQRTDPQHPASVVRPS